MASLPCFEASVDVQEFSTMGDSSTSAVSGLKGEGRLVLVEDVDYKEIKQEALKEEVVHEDHAGGLEWLKEFSQEVKTLFDPRNALGQLGEFRIAMQTLSAQMQNLTGQMRELQLLWLKTSLSSDAASPVSFESIKQEHLLTLQNQVFQTPRKSVEQPGRLDVTPVSTHSDSDQQNGTSSAAVANSRRFLAFPKTLEAILDHDHNKERSIPTLSLVDIKEEHDDNESPHRDSKLGLLVLADAALTRNPNQSAFVHRSVESFSEYDSGRSSGSSCRSSPSTSQEGVKVKSCEKFGRYGAYNNSRGIHVSIPQKSECSSSSSTSSDSKLRKRRKTKQPLPCSYCGKCFNNQSSLRQHESFHRPIRPFKCENEKCEKAYKTRSELNRHLVVHSGEKKHECKLCGKRFLRKQYLKTHLLRHHETGLAMVAPSAIESFRDDSTGTIPSIVVSSSLVSKTEPLTWRCQLCFKIFVNDEDLSRHVRSYHEKKKPLEGKLNINSEGYNKMEESF